MKAERPKLSREHDGGTTGVPASARQTTTACDENTDEHDAMTIEEVLRRENNLRAYQRVKQNRGPASSSTWRSRRVDTDSKVAIDRRACYPARLPVPRRC